MNQAKRRHVAFFTNTYHPVVSGVVRSISSFRQALSDLGHNVFVFAQDDHEFEDDEAFIFRYPAVEIPAQKFPLTIPVSMALDNVIPALKFDVIHAHHPILLGQVAARKAKELQVPLVFTHHTRYQMYSHYIALPQEMVKKGITRWLAEYMSKCHHIIVPSESIQMDLAETYGIEHQITVVPTGINLKPYQKADGTTIRQERGWEDKIVLISIGRLAEEKNWPLLFKAVQIATQKLGEPMGKQIRLAILGDGILRRKLEKLAQELGLAEQIELLGLVPYEQVPHYLKAADIFCFASITETQGLVTLEAMAAGLPVVAVAASGTDEAVSNGREGLLTENDSEQLATALYQLIQNKAQRMEYHQAALQKAARFDIDVLTQRLLDVYDQATIAQKAGRTVPMDDLKPIFAINWQAILGEDE